MSPYGSLISAPSFKHAWVFFSRVCCFEIYHKSYSIMTFSIADRNRSHGRETQSGGEEGCVHRQKTREYEQDNFIIPKPLVKFLVSSGACVPRVVYLLVMGCRHHGEPSIPVDIGTKNVWIVVHFMILLSLISAYYSPEHINILYWMHVSSVPSPSLLLSSSLLRIFHDRDRDRERK